jgi:hypothetical protein
MGLPPTKMLGAQFDIIKVLSDNSHKLVAVFKPITYPSHFYYAKLLILNSLGN